MQTISAKYLSQQKEVGKMEEALQNRQIIVQLHENEIKHVATSAAVEGDDATSEEEQLSDKQQKLALKCDSLLGKIVSDSKAGVGSRTKHNIAFQPMNSVIEILLQRRKKCTPGFTCLMDTGRRFILLKNN